MKRDAKGRFVSKEYNPLLRNVPKHVDWVKTAEEFVSLIKSGDNDCFLITTNQDMSSEVCADWRCSDCCFCNNCTQRFSIDEKINAFVELCKKHGVQLTEDAAGHWSVTKVKNEKTKKAEAVLPDIDWPHIVVQAFPSLSEPGDYSFAARCFVHEAGGVDVSFDKDHDVWVARRGGLEGRSTSADVAVYSLMRSCAVADSMTKDEED